METNAVRTFPSLRAGSEQRDYRTDVLQQLARACLSYGQYPDYLRLSLSSLHGILFGKVILERLNLSSDAIRQSRKPIFQWAQSREPCALSGGPHGSADPR